MQDSADYLARVFGMALVVKRLLRIRYGCEQDTLTRGGGVNGNREHAAGHSQGRYIVALDRMRKTSTTNIVTLEIVLFGPHIQHAPPVTQIRKDRGTMYVWPVCPTVHVGSRLTRF